MDDDADYELKLTELDHLLNDPDAPLQPQKVWSLLAEISQHDLSVPASGSSGQRAS